jgi:hypothetical protein
MIPVFLTVYGWIIAVICGLGWIWTEKQWRKAQARELEYIGMIAAHNMELRPSLAALKAAKRTALVLLVLLMPSLSHAQTAPLIIGNTLDAVSTEYAVRRGAVEVNPIMGSTTAQRLAVKSLGTMASVYLVQKLGQRHPRIARVVGYGIGGTLSLVAVRNVRSVKR